MEKRVIRHVIKKIIGFFIVGIGVYFLSANFIFNKNKKIIHAGDQIVDIKIPVKLTNIGYIGREIFNAKCSVCHGLNAAGIEGTGPPLVHRLYIKNHHGDEAFQRAVKMGVMSHHWQFGDMPPVKGMTHNDVIYIITYIRELQRENDIN